MNAVIMTPQTKPAIKPEIAGCSDEAYRAFCAGLSRLSIAGRMAAIRTAEQRGLISKSQGDSAFSIVKAEWLAPKLPKTKSKKKHKPRRLTPDWDIYSKRSAGILPWGGHGKGSLS